MDLKKQKSQYAQGMIAALACSSLWGILPIYWKSLKPIDSEVIILYRIVLMAICCFLLSGFLYGFKYTLKPLVSNKKLILMHIIAGFLITCNWSLYIWSVNAGYVIQTCMGYFLEPLIVCVFGLILYKEKLNFSKKIALFFACVGLGIMIIGYGEFPAIALGLAISFSVYAAIKKKLDTKPIQSLFYETLFIMPLALIIIVNLENKGGGALGFEGWKFGLLMLSGLMTAIPLGLFSSAATKLPLVTLGLTEYLSPSISLILGIFLFKENFDIIQFAAFVAIWIGLVFFTFGEVKDSKDIGA